MHTTRVQCTRQWGVRHSQCLRRMLSTAVRAAFVCLLTSLLPPPCAQLALPGTSSPVPSCPRLAPAPLCLQLKYWNSRAEALPGPDGIPLTGREDSTVVSSEEDATSLGRFVFHRRLLSFVKLRAQLIKEAKGRQVGACAACGAGDPPRWPQRAPVGPAGWHLAMAPLLLLGPALLLTQPKPRHPYGHRQ